MSMIEFFTGTPEERAILTQRNQLKPESNLTARQRRRLGVLDEQAESISRRLAVRKIGVGVGILGLGLPAVTAAVRVINKSGIEAEKVFDLSLNIDEAGFWRVVSQGSRFGIITQTTEKGKMDHLRSHKDLYVAADSPSFRVAINQPMADFIFSQAGLTNPAFPTRIIFVEDWIEGVRENHVGADTGLTEDHSEQHIRISLKAAALEAFLDMDRKALPLQQFDGAMSFFVSNYIAHEAAHAGRENKLLVSKNNIPSDSVFDAVHPQIYAFQSRYINLYNQALSRGAGAGALIFIINAEERTNLNIYKDQIYQQARDRGMIK